jgi:hypothetical protein
MEAVLRALCWGLVRVLISVLAGVGMGLLLVGRSEADRPHGWPRYAPPPGAFEGIGVGLLLAALLLIVLFVVPWMFRPAPRPDLPLIERALYGLGGGVVKLLICAVAGGGVACLFIGPAVAANPEVFQGSNAPTAALMLGSGAGLLTAALLLVVLFVLPWMFRNPAATPPAETAPGTTV